MVYPLVCERILMGQEQSLCQQGEVWTLVEFR